LRRLVKRSAKSDDVAAHATNREAVTYRECPPAENHEVASDRHYYAL
jgi:hypothetical protein